MLSGSNSIEDNREERYLFSVDIDESANYGNNYLPVTFYHEADSAKEELATGSVSINISRQIASSTLLDMAYKLEDGDALKAGETTGLTITVTNRGNNMLQDVRVTLGLPDSMSLDNSVAVQYVGYMNVGESKTVKFPVYVDKNAENKNHSVSVRMSGLSKGAATEFDRAVYLPVTGGEGKITSKDIKISDVSLPSEAAAGDDFTMTFSVQNDGENDVEDLRIEAAPETGVANKTQNVFVEPVLKPGESKAYSVTFFSEKDEAARKSHLIKISATVGTGDAAVSVSQYAGIFLNKEKTGEVKNPQLIVDNYSYGKDFVKAGETFSLLIELRNTSPEDISNIKVSLNAETGAFVPVGSSNSFFVDRIAANERVSRSVRLSVNPNAEQQTTPLNVAMTYENDAGDAFQAADVISVSVIQETSLTIDDVISQPELYPGVQSGADVRFYNTGKAQLRNLRVTAEGNFDMTEPAGYYAGNMASGANDSYSFSFIPRDEGSLDGKIVFTYEDPSGNKQTAEKEFSFPVMPPMPADEGFMPDAETAPPASRTPVYIGVGGAAALVVALIVLMKFLKRRKLHREMEIDDE
jgi:uncharacterized repeat protein (TIGR01451 family)